MSYKTYWIDNIAINYDTIFKISSNRIDTLNNEFCYLFY